jgi:7-carboxy-7-deazaguanine synthase
VITTLRVNEIYRSLQGESSFAGWPCIFIRLTACNLRCSYCDTAYAFKEGTRMEVAEIQARVRCLAGDTGPSAEGHRLPLVEVTGGEPLLQPAVHKLMEDLCNEGWTVLLETSGAVTIRQVDPRVRRIMDLKCPSSGEVHRNCWGNLSHLRPTDEVKFVIGTEADYAWAANVLRQHRLDTRCAVLFSWLAPLLPSQHHPSLKPFPAQERRLTRQELAERVIADRLPVRFQLQLHKLIWAPDAKGV